MNRRDEIINFVSQPAFCKGFSLLDLQNHQVGGAKADLHLKELEESGLIESLRNTKYGTASVTLMKVA